MSIQATLHDVLAMENLSFPKWDVDQDKQTFGHLLEDLGDLWRAKCSHCCNPQASETAIRHAEKQLGFSLPAELHTFLRITNGAKLFIVPRSGFDTPLVVYEMLGTEGIVALHRKAFDNFRYVFATDPELKNLKRLNYLAFCDLGDGNYLAVLLEGSDQGKIFFLDREGCFRPYKERYADMYYSLADSLENWLVLVRDTGGWGGRNMNSGRFCPIARRGKKVQERHMSIDTMLNQILAMDKLDIPKDETDERVKDIFGDLLEDHGDVWRVKCCHRCNPGASEAAIRQAEQRLGVPLPEQLKSFLRIANGVELFVAARQGLEQELPGTFHVRYKLFGTEELANKNNELWQFFRSDLGNDPGFRHFARLNYVAFCDVTDGNYLAILLEGGGAGKVFHLDKELSARPYRERDADMYYTLAGSLEEWFILLRDTGGWAGRGEMIGGF